MTLFESLDLDAKDARLLAGFLYARGLGVDRDLEKSRALLLEASKAGFPSAQFLLAWLMQSKQISEDENGQVVDLYTRAAEQGYRNAAFNLADLYERGELVNRDMNQAVRWYRKASERGCSIAAAHLGELYEKGTLVPRDETEALKWYQRSVELGDVAGHMHLARAYRNGTLGVGRNASRAAELDKIAETLRLRRDAEQLALLREAAVHGDKQSQEVLAMVYQTGGLGVTPDPEKARFWGTKAREIFSNL